MLNAFIDGDIQTPPLCTAATKGSVGLLVALLDKLGAHNNFKDSLGNTPLMNAIAKSHLPVVETLLAAGVTGRIHCPPQSCPSGVRCDSGCSLEVGGGKECTP
ncbi:unnamed protein product [Ectocarpus fasciculatus]